MRDHGPVIDAIAAVLSPAVGVAISPVPIIGVIVMLLSERARANGLAFLAGWVVGLTAATVAVLAIGTAANGDDGPSSAIGWVKLGLGVLLLVLAARNLRSRPASPEEAELPGWMATASTLPPARCAGLGFLLSAVNPKNLALSAAAAVSLVALDLPTGEVAAGVVAFVAIGSLSIGGAVISYLVAGERAGPVLERTEAWLRVHNAVIMGVLLLVIGVVLVSDGLAILGS